MHAPCLDWSRLGRSGQKAHMASCHLLQKVDFGLPRAKFFTRVDLDLQASRMFRPTPHTKNRSNFVQSYFVRTLAYRTWLRSLINALVSGLESMRAFWSGSLHGIMRLLCDDRRNEVQGIPALAGACGCTLLWIWTELPVHAPVSGLESIQALSSGSSHGIIWYLAQSRA